MLVTPSVTGLQIARQFRDQGVYMGLYEPKDANGKSIGKIFHLFAVEQLKNRRTFGNTVEYLGTLGDGFKASSQFTYHKELTESLKDGSAEGKLFIPPLEILNGRDTNDKRIFDRSMLALRDQGDFKGTFNTSGYASWYFSCTDRPGSSAFVRLGCFTGGEGVWSDKKSVNPAICRPCRVVEVGHLTP